jgi:hypothetical protein
MGERFIWAAACRCQGMTLDRVEASLSNAFDHGMVYVALSRVKSLAGLRLSGFAPSKVKAHPAVVAFYRKLGCVPPDEQPPPESFMDKLGIGREVNGLREATYDQVLQGLDGALWPEPVQGEYDPWNQTANHGVAESDGHQEGQGAAAMMDAEQERELKDLEDWERALDKAEGDDYCLPKGMITVPVSLMQMAGIASILVRISHLAKERKQEWHLSE